MRINAISKGIVASLALLGVTACGHNPAQEKIAEDRAVKYLTGEEYLKAKEMSNSCPDDEDLRNSKMQYWDSLLLVQRADEAYAKGVQMVRDSAAGKQYTKPKFDINFEYKAQSITDEIKKTQQEIANAHTGREFKDLVLCEPCEDNADFFPTRAHYVHFWNQIAIQGAEREAFNRGANAERAINKLSPLK